jgi:ribosomal protein L32
MCEDYPCCGHTDGLGCDWVSPSEIVPCDVCIEARTMNPYHDGWEGSCPTARQNRRLESARLEVPEGWACEECGESDSKHSEFEFLCFNCGEDADYYHRQMLIETGAYDN